MITKDIQQKIANCKALQGMTVEDVIGTERFRNNLGAYLGAQKEDREAIRRSYQAMRKLGGAKGYKLPAHPIDRVINFSVEEFVDEYKAVISGISKQSAAVRQYIKQLGQQAYNLTVIQYVVDEYPELSDTLLPKSKAN